MKKVLLSVLGLAAGLFAGVANGYETPAHLKCPYVAVKYVTPTLTVGERCRIGWYVTDFDHSLWRFADGTRRFDVFATWTKDDANWQTVSREDVPSCDGEFDLGELPAGEYSVGVWCRDRLNGLESHRVWHEFRVVEKGALDIPEAKVRRMTAADLTAYGLRNDGDYERFVLIDAFDPSTRNGGQFNLKIDEITAECLEIVDAYLAEHPHVSPGGRPGYTVYTAAFNGAPIDRAFYRKRLRYDDGYDKAAVAAIAEANSIGLQKFLDDAAAAGCRKVVLQPGTYRVSHLYTLKLPDRMTVDLNGATLKLNGFDGAGTLMVRFAGVTDTHLVNGTVEGDYYEHSYRETPSPEQVHGWCFSGACRYCSVEGVTTKNVTGYGGGNGEGTGLGAGCTAERSLSGANSGFIPGGLAADGTVDASDPAQWTSPYVDITAYRPYHYFTVSYGLGYAGVRTRNWTYRCAFYDEGLNFLSRVTAFQYRVVRIPPAAKYARFSIEVANEQEALNNELTIRLPYVPRNCIVAHNVYDRCRCVGHASSAMSNFLFLENEFRYSGECQATCAYDAEDGWDNMQDVLFLRNDFHDNNRNELLTCCGHNFQMIGNRAKISLNARTFSPWVVSNDCKSASFDCTQRTRTGYARYADNVYRGSLALGSGGYSDWDVVLRGLNFPLPGETGPTTVTGARNGRFSGCTFSNITVRVQRAEDCAFVGCESGLDRWQNGLWNDCTVTRCTFTKQSCTNRYENCAFDGTSFASMTLKAVQEFVGCDLSGTTFPKSPNLPPEFCNCTGVPSGYANVRAVYVDAAAADGGDGSVARPFRTIAEGLAAAIDGVTLVEVAAGTYEVSEPLVVGSGLTLRAARGAKVTVDAGYRCTALQADAAATVEGITVSRDISTRPVPPTPRTFRVDGSAAAGGDGSAGAPFRTIAEGVAAAQNEGDVVEVADGTYAISETIVVDRPVVVRPVTGATVTVDANHSCRCFSIDNADAVVEGLCIRRGRTTANNSCNGNGVLFGANGGTLRNCTVELCQGGIGSKGCGVYLNGGALVTGCTIRNCQANANGTEYGIGAYLAKGTLERCLVTGCTRTGFKDSQPADGAVYVNRGTVRRCTIAGNSVSRATLHVADLPSSIVRDTVVWGNTTTRDDSAGRPNLGDIGVNPDISGLCTTVAAGRNPVAKNPSFVNSAEGDYRLSCASPCRGAGTDGCDLGCFDYEPVGAPAIAVSASSGVGKLQATVSLLSDDPSALQGATVAWALNGEPIDVTGASFGWTFGPGAWDISAAVTFADGTTAEARLPRAVEVCYTGDIDVTPADDLNAIFDLARSGLRLRLAEGTYPVSRALSLADDIRLVGTGDRTKTVLQRTAEGSGRVLYLNDARAFVANVTVTGGTGDREGGGVWIDANGGTVSNCVIRGNASSTNAGGGGAYLNSPKAVLSHSLIVSNTAGGSSAGGGVLLSQGTLADCLVISNGMQYADRSNSLGGGVCLSKATADAKVVNCTIARNRGYSGCGLYRKANAGYVVNTLIYDNVQMGTAELVTPNWTSESGSTRPTETAFSNCCSDVAVGANAQVVASAPYDAAYRLDGDAALACVDKGLTDAAFSSVDYEGGPRVLGKAVDIGAIECTTIEIGVIHVDINAPTGGDGTRARPFTTIADGIAAAGEDEDTVLIASGTYPITAALSVAKAITVKPERGASVTVDAQSKCQCLSINHADAVVEGIRFYRGQLNGNGAGVAIGTNGGTLRDCIVESCRMGNGSKGPGIYMNSANALVTGCQVRECGTGGFNGDYNCHGVYVDNGTLDHTLVVGCKNTNSYRDGKKGTAAVYLAKGTVRNCTIVGNEVSHYGLYCADANTCHVMDTISWDNVSLRGVDANCPNANDIGTKADVVNLCLDNPMFANTTDYALAPGSPCIGAGTDGCDLGWKAYDASVPAIGVKVSASKGPAPLEVTVELTANVPVASVVWEGVEASGTSFVTTLGGGYHRIKATATLAGGGTLTAENVVAVAYPTGEYEVSDVETLEWMLSSPLADGVVIKLADGNYPITANCYALRSGVKIVGTSRENTVLSKAKGATGRFFYMNHKDAELDNLTVTGGKAGCSAGGIWIDGRGGTVSNCVVRGCETGASQAGGGVWMNSPNALVTHSVISKNTVGQNTYCGGVLLSQGTLADSLIVSNTAQYSTRTQVKGVGVYMDTATADAKVVNCTIARNTGYQSVGLYRVANGGYVCNTIVYDNTASDHNADDNFYSGGGATRPTAAAILNCASSVALGTNPQTLSVLPYDPATYELDSATGGACIDKGANEAVVSATDFYGNDRIFQGKTVDIGAHEYSKTTVEVGFTSSATKGVDSVEVTLTATVLGADVTDDDIAWYVDGGEEPVGTGKTYVHTFGVGRHSIRMAVDVGGTIYEKVSDDKTSVTVYPSDVYVDANSTVEPVWPYGKDAPATNFNAAVAETLVEGVTIHVAEGLYPMTARVELGPDEHIVGAGMDRTVLYHPKKGAAGFHLKSPSATVDGLCVSNSAASYGGGFRIEGGTVTRCRASHCEAGTNEDGGGVFITGSSSVFDGGVVSDCSRYQWNGTTLANGGGVALDNGGTLRNSLVVRCTSNNAGGVTAAGGSIVRNCTVVSNSCSMTGKGGGGIVATSGCKIENCIAWGNVDKDEPDPTLAKHNIVGGDVANCCVPVAVGTNCATADPQFKDAANGDYRIGGSSPCAYSGLYQSWMAGATDLYGNPRTTPGKKVSIGSCQAPDPGLMLLVR